MAGRYGTVPVPYRTEARYGVPTGTAFFEIFFFLENFFKTFFIENLNKYNDVFD